MYSRARASAWVQFGRVLLSSSSPCSILHIDELKIRKSSKRVCIWHSGYNLFGLCVCIYVWVFRSVKNLQTCISVYIPIYHCTSLSRHEKRIQRLLIHGNKYTFCSTEKKEQTWRSTQQQDPKEATSYLGISYALLVLGYTKYKWCRQAHIAEYGVAWWIFRPQFQLEHSPGSGYCCWKSFLATKCCQSPWKATRTNISRQFNNHSSGKKKFIRLSWKFFMRIKDAGSSKDTLDPSHGLRETKYHAKYC